jgi:3-hydroxybutyryl-CoA dehydrogenase
MTIKNILAIGAGTMGSQPSFYYAMQGYDVIQYDITDSALENANALHQTYGEAYRAVFTETTDADIEAGLSRISYTTDLAAAAKNADLVTESVPEVLEIKQDIYSKLSNLCPEHTIFATNTSTMLPSDMAEFTGRPDRFLALHYGLPMWNTRIGEVMKHPGTAHEVFEQVVKFVEDANLIPIKLEKEQPGYITNSLLVPWVTAGMGLVANEISSVEDVDRTWMQCTKMQAGPLGIIDSLGFEVARNVSNLMAAANPADPILPKIIAMLNDSIAKGHTGELSGQGFYSYPNPSYLEPGFVT